jgi:hypothetical protein
VKDEWMDGWIVVVVVVVVVVCGGWEDGRLKTRRKLSLVQ